MSKLSVRTKWFVTLAIIASGMAVIGSFQSPGKAEFRLHRTRYEQIIAKVKATGYDPLKGLRPWVSADLDPASFGRKRVNNGDMAGMIEVSRDEATGAYSVSITTMDSGHFGTFGYVYSDTPNVFPTGINMYLTAERQLDAHWWIAENRSW